MNEDTPETIQILTTEHNIDNAANNAEIPELPLKIKQKRKALWVGLIIGLASGAFVLYSYNEYLQCVGCGFGFMLQSFIFYYVFIPFVLISIIGLIRTSKIYLYKKRSLINAIFGIIISLTTLYIMYSSLIIYYLQNYTTNILEYIQFSGIWLLLEFAIFTIGLNLTLKSLHVNNRLAIVPIVTVFMAVLLILFAIFIMPIFV